MIPFNKPYMTGDELKYIKDAHLNEHLSGDGIFSKKSSAWIEVNLSIQKALLTHSCTAALEMTAILADIREGDEVIMPSFTFVSTANAFVLRGGVPVFVDIRDDTLNINESLIENAITPKTKAIIPVHYAGVACEMDAIINIANKHKLLVIEDAAQGIMSTYKGRALGSIGDMGAFSFHETKNISSGEGGALLINDSSFIQRAEIIREKGTNRADFFRGYSDKYSWVDIGSSYLPGEITTAFLLAQLENANKITKSRIKAWKYYYNALSQLEEEGNLRRPVIPIDCQHNGHIFYIIVANLNIRTRLINYLMDRGINSLFHYVPLHNSIGGRKFSRYSGNMRITEHISDSIIRLPLFVEITKEQQNKVINSIYEFFKIKT
jgi:dTDP-4-amino-4,6-dideoxygalactose transaminase